MAVLMSDGRIAEPPQVQGPGLFQLAFRPFFLGGALFSAVAVLLWAAMISGDLAIEPFGSPLWWHAHEMLFGFTCAIIVGFLLTAVQTWTGIAGIRGLPLIGLLLLWFAGRLCLLLPGLPQWLPVVLDMLFLPLAALILSLPIIRIRQWRNIVFLPVLLAMTLANGLFYLAAFRLDPALQVLAGNFMVMLITLLMTVVAGRVTPMFTANGTGTERVEPLPWLERLCPASLLLAIPAVLGLYPPGPIGPSLLIFAAACHGLRVWRWRTWVTFSTPLLWSLHLSYWALVSGLALLAIAQLGDSLSHSQALHVLTVGAMGMMILAMISRVSLGHTGRPLQVGPAMILAYCAVISAVIVRVAGQWWLEDYRQVIWITAALWSLAYGIFFLRYLPVLSRPRPDGRPG